MGKFLDADGLKQVWDTAKGTFVKKEEGKGLSSNDFSDEWKKKIEDLAMYRWQSLLLLTM